MPNLYSRLLSILTLTICLGVVVGPVRAADTDPEGRLYQPSESPLADVQQALSRAGDGDRLALVVLGANWCHDSRALASRLHSSPLAELIQQNYELVFVDVGFYDKGRAVAQQFGVAHYYATPTVLIIDPLNGQLVNDEDRHIWGNAFNIDMSSSVRYFEKWAMNDTVADPVVDSTQLKRLYAQIDQLSSNRRSGWPRATPWSVRCWRPTRTAMRPRNSTRAGMSCATSGQPSLRTSVRFETRHNGACPRVRKIFSCCFRSTHCCPGSPANITNSMGHRILRALLPRPRANPFSQGKPGSADRP